MEVDVKVKEDNYKVFALMSNYLNNAPDYIEGEDIDALVQYGVSPEYAFAVTLVAAFGLDIVDRAEDKDLFEIYFKNMFHKLDVTEYELNSYYQNIKIPTVKIGKSDLKYEKYKPFEAFVCEDIIKMKDGRQIPQIGFFEKEFSYPAVLEDGRIWMTITPNEIETMKEAVYDASGRVLTYGLGLGYYAFMVSEKTNVESITVVEKNKDVIHLFNKYILPQFKQRHKVKIIQADAFEYAQNQMAKAQYDFVFTDLWHDVSDGIDMYLKMKELEQNSPHTKFKYWIERSILCYL
ncbi:hypothetical protein M3182_02410 [Mesobacillus maritimus]|uniref:spermine/spermidine synthase domain-containing protein n=1 Tax=Mesobacillus maritimus TaxID=1643336 RepID=UPI002040B64B|nr:hypothetical protein [Mesobacillus maritimus]MCM3584595.1 hypothetical protein [Mesobacillus maritimus]MCM3671885.1 hypothetical protein [Mesobacillus maritimus]